MNAIQERTLCDTRDITTLLEGRAGAAIPGEPIASRRALPEDVFPVSLSETLTVTHVLPAAGRGRTGSQPTVDAVFSKRACEGTASGEGAHDILAGETLFAHGNTLPPQAVAILEPLDNAFQSAITLEAYGWNTLKSVKLPEQLCDGHYRLTITSSSGNTRSNSVLIRVRPVHAAQYVTLFKGMRCLQTASETNSDTPYLLGVAVDEQGWKTIACGAWEQVKMQTRVSADLEMGGKYDSKGNIEPTETPGQAVFHIGMGSANNFRPSWLGRRWNIDSYDVLFGDKWGDHKATELWSHLVTDREFLCQPDLTRPELAETLAEYVQATIADSGSGDTLLGTATLTWTREEVETARKVNGTQDVVKFVDVRSGRAHYRLEFHLRRTYRQ